MGGAPPWSREKRPDPTLSDAGSFRVFSPSTWWVFAAYKRPALTPPTDSPKLYKFDTCTRARASATPAPYLTVRNFGCGGFQNRKPLNFCPPYSLQAGFSHSLKRGPRPVRVIF